MTINQLLTSYNNFMPIDSAEELSSGLQWLACVNLFAIEEPASNLPNRDFIQVETQRYMSELNIHSTNWDIPNNNILHIKDYLQAVITNHEQPST